jgi:hypothetical protein
MANVVVGALSGYLACPLFITYHHPSDKYWKSLSLKCLAERRSSNHLFPFEVGGSGVLFSRGSNTCMPGILIFAYSQSTHVKT